MNKTKLLKNMTRRLRLISFQWKTYKHFGGRVQGNDPARD
jgi:hypothetical protein